MRKAGLIFLLFSTIKLMISCGCDCPEISFLNYEISQIDVTLLDNSEEYTIWTDSTATISAKALGLRITLTDSSMNDELHYMSHVPKQKSNYGFTASYAFSCDCDYYDYYFDNKIDSIQITTVLDFSDKYTKNSTISHMFLAKRRNDALTNMYLTKCEILEELNKENIIDYPEIAFDLILTKAPINNKAQFEIIIHLANGNKVRKTTPTIHLELF